MGRERGGAGRGRGAGRAFKAGSGRSWRSPAAVGARAQAGVRLFMFRSSPFKCFPRRRRQSLASQLLSRFPALPPPRPLVTLLLADGPEAGDGAGSSLLPSSPAGREGERGSERARALVTSRKKKTREEGGQAARRVFAKGRA